MKELGVILGNFFKAIELVSDIQADSFAGYGLLSSYSGIRTYK